MSMNWRPIYVERDYRWYAIHIGFYKESGESHGTIPPTQLHTTAKADIYI